jgi:hypothetical protein
MKRLLAALLLALSIHASAMWVTNGIVTNPAAATVIADTGAIGGGASTYTVIVAATVISRFEMAVRNAANNADVTVQNFFVPANGNFTAVLPIDVPPGGRIVIRTPASITGSVQGSILKDGPA